MFTLAPAFTPHDTTFLSVYACASLTIRLLVRILQETRWLFNASLGSCNPIIVSIIFSEIHSLKAGERECRYSHLKSEKEEKHSSMHVPERNITSGHGPLDISSEPVLFFYLFM